MEQKDVRDLLYDEIVSQFDKLDYYEPGSKEYDAAMDGLETVYKLKIDQDAKECEAYDKEDKRALDAEFHEKELELDREKFEFEKSYKETQIFEQKVDRVLKAIIEIGTPIMTYHFLSKWMERGFKFEETGTYTSQTHKWFFGRFKLPFFK